MVVPVQRLAIMLPLEEQTEVNTERPVTKQGVSNKAHSPSPEAQNTSTQQNTQPRVRRSERIRALAGATALLQLHKQVEQFSSAWHSRTSEEELTD